MARRRLDVVTITLVIAVFYVLTIRSGHPWGDDFVQYLQHAMNLAAGDPYGAHPYVVNPSRSIGPPAYPPVFPLMLLPFVKAVGVDFAVLKVLMSLLFGVALASIAMAFADPLRGRRLVALVLILAAAPTFWTFKEAIYSDVPFLVFCFLSLALMQRLVSSPSGPSLHSLALLTGLAMYLACGTRSQGLPLLPTLLVADLWRAKRIRFAPLLACGLAVLLLVIQNRLVPTEGERLQYLSLDPALLWANVVHYAGSLSTFWDNGYSHFLRYLFFGVALVLAAVGYLRRAREGLGPLEVFLPLFLLPLLPWVFQQGIRYLLPTVPLYVFYVLEGVQEISERVQPRHARVAQSVLLVAVFGCFLARYTTIDLRHIEGPLDRGPQEMFRYVEAHSAPNDLILFEKPRVLSLMAHRRTAIPSRTESAADDAVALDFYRTIGAKYVVAGRSFVTDAASLRPFLSRNPGWAEKVWSNDEFDLWQIRHDAGR